MDCQNCTSTVFDFNNQSNQLVQQRNCWIVIIFSFVFLAGFWKICKIFFRILSPLSWIPRNLYKIYVPDNSQSWALITGGSEGIGLGFAEELAIIGFSIILMSRSQTKLKQAKNRIQKLNPNVQVQYFSVDFQKLRTAEHYEQLFDKIKHFDISILVNNVGIFNSTCYLDSSYELIKRQSIVNILPITCLTRLILPKMIERNKNLKKRCAIINLSSASALTALKYSAHYCSTKAYDDLFTHSVAVQYRNQAVDFLCLRPFLVTTPLSRNQKSILHVSSNQCAQGALCDLGRQTVSYGHIWHRIQGVIMEQINGKVVNWIMCRFSKSLSQKYKQIDEKNK